MRITVDTIVRTICLLLALVNQCLAVAGKQVLPFADEDVYQIISLAATFVTAGIAWWKNNSFTKEAIEADAIMREMKGEKAA